MSRSSPPACSALSPWHHYVTLHIRKNGWTQSWLSVLIYARTIFAAKIIAQREHPGYTAIKVDGVAVIPSPNDPGELPPPTAPKSSTAASGG